MRGPESSQRVLFSMVDLEDRVPADHPLRAIRALVEPVLDELAPRGAALQSPAEVRPSCGLERPEDHWKDVREATGDIPKAAPLLVLS